MNSSRYHVFSSNSPKLSLWCEKKNHSPHRWICIAHIWSLTLFPRGIIIFQGVLTQLNFSTKFTHLEKIVNLMKDLKYEHQSIFPFLGRVKLNFGDRYRKPNIFSKNSSHCQFFSSNSQKMRLCNKKNSLPTQMDLYSPYMVPYTIPSGNYNFKRSTNKIPFFWQNFHI